MPRINRRKSIHTPPRRDRISPSKRAPMPDDGPTDFALQRKAEQIGQGVYCDLNRQGRVEITGGPGARARAEFATSSTLALLYDREKIDAKQLRAGNEYMRLHRLLWGRSTPPASGLSKVLATPLPDRLAEAAHASRDREELDEEGYIEWMQEQRTLYERAEYRLRHLPGSITHRRLVRITLRAVILDDVMPTEPAHLARLRLGLAHLAEVWGIE